jgi:hypothetical protein
MSTAEEKFKERMEIRNDLLALKRPKRLFVLPSFSIEAACGYAGVDLKRANSDMELTEKAYDKICADFPSDAMPTSSPRFMPVYQLLGAKNFVFASNGAVQHPESEPMNVEDYDEFIAAPYKTILEKIMPRVCKALDKDPVSNALNLAAAYSTFKSLNSAQFAVFAKLRAKYGFAPGLITHQNIVAPFDFLADEFRGFRGINMDVRRYPDKVKAAVEAIAPLMIRLATPAVMRPGLIVMIPLHMAPFISRKAFEELYWPTLEQVVVELDKAGIASFLIAQNNWTNYCEYLERLPASSKLSMEQGDPRRFTETVGKNHVFGGFYDPTITLARSKEECIDEAKRLFDICMKSDHFYFRFDRGVMDMKSVNIPKLQAVLEWVYENGKY